MTAAPDVPAREDAAAAVAFTGEDPLTSTGAGAKVIRGSIWRVAGNLAGILAGLGTAALLLRHLGVAGAGRYVTVMSLVAIAGNIADAGLNLTTSRELAVRDPSRRPGLIASLLGLRIAITPVALLLIVGFALAVGYPTSMVAGTALAGLGYMLASLADALLLRLTVELRNAGLALVDFLRQAVTLSGVALLVALGSSLTPFFAVQIVVGVVLLAIAPLLVGSGGLVAPRLHRVEQRALLTRALPVAAALILGQIYVRFVMVLMSLISTPRQAGFFAASLRAIEAQTAIALFVAGVALPMLAASRADMPRLRYAVRGLSEGAAIAGVLIVIVTARLAEPAMSLIGGPGFRGSGAVLRIQVGALLFIALYQIWTVALIALGRRRDLILTNAAALLGVIVYAVLLVPSFGAIGGAIASVLGDATLAFLVYWRLHAAGAKIAIRAGFVARLLAAAAVASGLLLVPGVAAVPAAVLAGGAFLAVGQAIGMVPPELHEALGLRRTR